MRLALLLSAAVMVGPVPALSGQPPVPDSLRPDSLVPGRLEIVGTFDYDWSVRSADGREVDLTSWRGEVLVINVWATWCPPCVAELGSFERLGRALGNLGADVRLVLVSPESPEVVAEFARRHDFDLDLVVEERRMPDSLGELVLPTTFVVDREGRIVLRHRGASDWAQPSVLAFLRSLAAGEEYGEPRRPIRVDPRR